MPNKPRDRQSALSKSGFLPRPVFEPEGRKEPPPPPVSLPEFRDEQSATTGIFPIVSEGYDSSAVGDDDRVIASEGSS
jgi:hypothetical protein